MAFTVNDYHDLVRLLADHPEWKAELRRLLLSEELLALPEIVRELAEAQRRTEARLGDLVKVQGRTEERLDDLVKAHQRTEERLDDLAEVQRRTEERIEVLADGQQCLADGQQRLIDTVGGLKGRVLEITYQNRAGAYFGRFLRRVKVVTPQTLEDGLEVALSTDEFDDVLLLDLLVTGKLRHHPESPDVWLAVEISAVVDRNDVDRAVRRADLVRRVGHHTVPVVAGEDVTQGGKAAARNQKVALLQDGQMYFWDEALSASGNL